MQRTALYAKHLESGAKMVDFAGWEMPIHYGSQLQEHHQVRNDAGMFDVSHMVILDLVGAQSKAFLQYLLANNVDKLKDSGKALYSCMLTPEGTVIDDLIVYFITDTQWRIVVNAGTRDKDIAWMQKQIANFDATLTERDDLSMIAAQGPNARAKVLGIMPADEVAIVEPLKTFYGAFVNDWFIARTGYTGEDGFEMMFPNAQAHKVWDALLAAGIKPIGLGARDTLRLEAGMNLYGTDMDETTSPLVSGLGWTIGWQPEDRNFIGRSALEAQKAAGVPQKFVGLVLEGKGVLRSHMKVVCNGGDGETTSGTFSPTLGVAIALARVPASCTDTCEVDIRGKLHPAKVVKPVFARNGKSVLN
ncbi:glycine cleavage system aminomethyltransferase GcvT [Thiothrix subterranea]|uniref:Aminomethyltransferase n=1 Tax=Thiothrix subterranea TaxID=2735563 RepID=A0AA51R0H8_9GAMM|nr:glycine cleavage system aminomethyltransferase GcvT [Thiothrix subterranea]MDQ5769632.1 glycine cleavage system aminomethyltransferase GcvT [Thiothrix subterranea]WML85704.1 glycine cleavage system aminomethyltransferase GcvT [Thiothrix subterranea]